MTTASLAGFLGRIPLLGRGLRCLAAKYSEESVVTIHTGLASGMKWRRHHRYVNGYWIGHYELPIQNALKQHLRPGQTFFDVGANAGFFTMIAARLVGPSGRCFAFDPAPENVASIREQIDLNELRQCSAVQAAVGAEPGEADFYFDMAGSPTGHLANKSAGASSSGSHRLWVEVETLDLAATKYARPDFIKMDVEGAEVAALEGAKGLLTDVRPAWLIELHGSAKARQVRDILVAADYRLFSLDSKAVDLARPLPGHIVARPA